MVKIKELEWNSNEARSPNGDLYSVVGLSAHVWITLLNGVQFPGWKSSREAAMLIASDDHKERTQNKQNSTGLLWTLWSRESDGQTWLMIGNVGGRSAALSCITMIDGKETIVSQVVKEFASEYERHILPALDAKDALIAELVEALDPIMDMASAYEDAGPPHDTYQSDAWVTKLKKAEAALSKAKAGA